MIMQTQSAYRSASESPASRERAKTTKLNIGTSERVLSTAGGVLLTLRGIRRGGLGGLAAAGLGAAMFQRGVTGHCSLYEKAGIDTRTEEHGTARAFQERGIHVAQAYTINRSPHDLYEFWRNFQNLPGFMRHLREVTVLDEKRSHWKANGPAGFSVEWDAEIINDETDRVIAWRSLEKSDVDSSGSVRFVDTGDRGTEVRVVLDYIPPLGRLGAMVARIFGEEPKQQIQEDLRHFKQLMESGEIPTAQGPRGSCRGNHSQSQRLEP